MAGIVDMEEVADLLRAEIDRLRAALEEIVNWKTAKLHWGDIARKALANEKEK